MSYLDSDENPSHIIIAGLRLIFFITISYWYTTWNTNVMGVMYGMATY